MQLEARKYLYDILQAADLLASFSQGKILEQYQHDPMLRSAIERQFEITGEALNQLLKLAPDLASRITEHKRIIAFRNILIHGYAEVDGRIVWGVLEQKLPLLREEVSKLLATKS
jgi:uncharacterized protein with HEPN domain